MQKRSLLWYLKIFWLNYFSTVFIKGFIMLWVSRILILLLIPSNTYRADVHINTLSQIIFMRDDGLESCFLPWESTNLLLPSVSRELTFSSHFFLLLSSPVVRSLVHISFATFSIFAGHSNLLATLFSLFLLAVYFFLQAISNLQVWCLCLLSHVSTNGKYD